MEILRRWYEPHLERVHQNFAIRAGDLERLEQIDARYATRERFPSDSRPARRDRRRARRAALDEHYLLLSTIHSAKGQEWDAVFVLNVADGCIPPTWRPAVLSHALPSRRT